MWGYLACPPHSDADQAARRQYSEARPAPGVQGRALRLLSGSVLISNSER